MEEILDTRDIEPYGSITAKGADRNIHCLTVVGQIEGHSLLPQNAKTTKYEHVMPQLAAIEESAEIDALLILLNTVGGDVEAGMALAELIRGMKKPNASLVLGGGHSIGVPLATAASRSFIAPSAAMTIHPVRMSGTMISLPQTYLYFERIQERIIRFVVETSRISEADFRRLMTDTNSAPSGEVGSVLYGEEAVSAGLIDQAGGLSDALEYLHSKIPKKNPA